MPKDNKTKVQFVENLTERYDRFSTANARLENWKPQLEEAYRFIFPNRESFYESTPGEAKSDTVFDETAVVAAIQFANNLQSLLMPPYRRWIEIVAGDKLNKADIINDDEIKKINERLQDDTKTLFGNLNNSNFNYVINEAFQDVCVGTAVIATNEGTYDRPLEFLSLPIKDVCFEEYVDGMIKSVWHKLKIPLRQIKQKWPKAQLSSTIDQLLKTNPNENINLIEACIYYPDNSYESKYVYYITTEDGKEEILKPEFREFNPFTVARYSKSAGEIFGRGVGLLALPLIKTLNKMEEETLSSVKFRTTPAYLVSNTSVLNVYNLRIEPGSLIPVNPGLESNRAPIEPIPNAGDPKFGEMSIRDMRTTLKELFFADPLGMPGTTPNQTATEASLRQQNFVRQNGAAIGRLAYEFIVPIVNKCLIILRKKGIITDINTSLGKQVISIDDKTIDLKYSSPLLNLQNQEDAQNLMQYLSFLMQSFGAQGLVAIDIFKIPSRIAELMGIDLDLIKNESEIQQAFQQMQQTIQQQQTQNQIDPALAQSQGSVGGVPAQQASPQQQG